MIIEQGTTKFELTKPEVDCLRAILQMMDLEFYNNRNYRDGYTAQWQYGDNRVIQISEIRQFIKDTKELLQ